MAAIEEVVSELFSFSSEGTCYEFVSVYGSESGRIHVQLSRVILVACSSQNWLSGHAAASVKPTDGFKGIVYLTCSGKKRVCFRKVLPHGVYAVERGGPW